MRSKAKGSTSMIITLTTDFGLRDAYVGSMKGVILSINPNVRIVDIAHDLPPHKILAAAIIMREACPRFPLGTIHVGVVDPGVGGSRRPVLLEIEGHYYIGPDNGIFGLLMDSFRLEGAWSLDNPEYFLPSVSRTFHGRDIFAPAASHLALGTAPWRFGPPIEDLSGLSIPPHREEGARLTGEVVWIDRFGNCMTNLPEQLVNRWARSAPLVVRAASKRIKGIVPSYESVPIGEPLAIFNSMGYLELACRQERADRKLRLKEGSPVILETIRQDGRGGRSRR